MYRKLLLASALLMLAPAAFAAGNCSVDLEGNDQMRFNLSSITVPSSCQQFTINLKHVGTMAKTVMGHNVIVAKTSDMRGIETDGIRAGLAADYVKAGDTRVVVHSRVIGGGETASVTFPVAKITSGGPYSFFCSFPGHAALMKGTITVQ
ncbi:MAG: azurin [Xanthomonadaceae bacterium]|jgi:azurin|nr:azurin [Xanthomonadaceae bacterium]